MTVDSCSGLPGRITPPPQKDPAHQTTEAPWEVRGLQQGVEALRAGGDLGQEYQTHLPSNKAVCGNLILRSQKWGLTVRSSEHETLERKSAMKKAACEFKMISFHHFPEEAYFSLKSSWVDRQAPFIHPQGNY